MKNHFVEALIQHLIYGIHLRCTVCLRRSLLKRNRCGRDRMVVGFTTTYAISAYHH